MRGIFISGPTYDEGDPRWTADAQIAGKEKPETLWLFDLGITPNGSGERWSDLVTIVEDVQ